jgi:long-chain acyl-CoA synthetase
MSLLLLPLKIFLITLDFAIAMLTFGWVGILKKLLSKEPTRSVPVGDDPTHRVHADYKGNLASRPYPETTTLFEISARAFKRYGPQNCMGSREYLGMKSVKPPVKHFGDVHWKTYSDVETEALKFGAALRKAGLEPAQEDATLEKLTTSCSMAIFENTCAEWMVAAQGAFSQSIIVTTIYATLGIDAVADAVQEGGIKAMVCNKRSVKSVVGGLKTMPSLTTIIYTNDNIASDDVIDMPEVPAGITVISMEDFIASGDTKAFPPSPPSSDTMAVLMYTSGSTGKPKGVVITHGQIVAAISAGKVALGIQPGEVYLGYLPLAHILELMAEFCMLSEGATICYACPKTLTVKGSYPRGALEDYSPSLMAGVPKIWDVIKKGVEAKVAASSSVAKFLVNTAFQARTFAINHGYDTPLFKALVFKKFSKVVGGNLRLALSGGGPLNSEVQVFIRTCFGCPLVQGYGLTETCAGLTIQDPLDLRSGIAGVPIPSVEAKLLSCSEIKDKAGQPYLVSDTKDVEGNTVHGRGEVLVKGNSVTVGYYMMQDKTDEVYDKDGFFHTGDVGQFMEDGSIRIVDRVKNLVKLKGGEYIAVENMEMTYGNSGFVDAVNGGICCYGDGDMDRPIALITLSEPATMQWAKENNKSGDYKAVRESKDFHSAVLADMLVEAKKGGLSHLEKLVAISFITEPWTPDNGCLTAANKLQRRAVIEKFSKEFEEVKAKGIF